ncbi:hypothetical protein FD33_GL000848 [Companilactobacillus paralimentarius DSM 13238 = JCM 10415]|uniref:Cof-like hydrolase n=1 Tax=Companilactobacillus paralimentarius DSM 13238 = JCM 10415 TaxID=1122151 RepID=A0A0R1PAP9_9LACO|nr:Cof-type HAD-IIB family hydrolase [Companilactobacillus paralimentarius]KAE9561141.1 hydrolase [Companilactobacillus paralimentarius]KRL29552.1 hypothetical protein FD33_GL000848 [Companilactobacillus paralimentarius DSM 13238 = JCM 10415]MDR4933288.1 Cof-type HAD-IIB family hydrolase [Companilactobacillus paralimentarius]QFR69789.1 Cof-type HAD-IIB family hydrolase [Companilactobacillus paralimentarius]
MADIKLILSDIDGTILNDKNVVDSDLKENIVKLNHRKIPFILASARSPRGMITLAKELGVMDNPIACYNGALVVKDLQDSDYTTILSHGLNLLEVKQIFQILQKKFPEISINLYSGADWYVENLDKWVKIEADITNMTPIATDLNQLVDKLEIPIHKLLLIGESSEISKAMKYLQNVNLENSSFYLSKDNYLEITASRVSKEHVLRELADYYHIKLNNTMTLGDNFNDVPMLNLAEVGVAMDNAPVDVKTHANFVTKSNNENGVSYAIEKYVLKR